MFEGSARRELEELLDAIDKADPDELVAIARCFEDSPHPWARRGARTVLGRLGGE
jgi:hypothetical protein